ncbi:phosphoadenylylsulfate reductase (thioredoxin) [Rhodovulum sp. ES.010]|uniref:phosphoadenylyl-sulfate reductase n=1 Tax=Rhodovulum sp. ES.010 TaxID=1882821 RepID=UPI00092CBF25|nr:phosphoadenylyl-sulfate reductase [Rhodovulum sp. ES.010]SIO38479.1 phosphoadenylylsulfate reductase (thioredoxin) [Rhodovulum sp. ES.010]
MRPDPRRLRALNAFYADRDTSEIVAHVARGLFGGRAALVSSFGAESVVLLHMWADADRTAPVLFVDTEMLFAETLAYQREVADRLGLSNIVRIAPDSAAVKAEDPDRTLHGRDADACCTLRKVRPLARALGDYDVLVSGRKRYQTDSRADLAVFEQDEAGRLKVNPLTHWRPERIAAYMDEHRLPRHPLVARGFRSIGCAPCTTPVAEGEDPRAGRWRGSEKAECGIHFIDGRTVRPGREDAA